MKFLLTLRKHIKCFFSIGRGGFNMSHCLLLISSTYFLEVKKKKKKKSKSSIDIMNQLHE